VLRRNRLVGAAALAAAGTLVLGACGSDNNSSGGGSSPSNNGSGTTNAAGGITCSSGTLTASGSTAQTNAMSQWTKAYQTQCGSATINYQGGGSGQGVTQFTAGTVDFAGSDFPLSSAQKPDADKRCGSGNQAIDIPMVPGPIAVAYNLPGVTDLKLSASNVAKIFSGKITKWNDQAIKADNPSANLPGTSIQTFHRSDGSGTSYNFTNYLSNDAKSDWTYGVNKNWPAPGGQGAKGSSSVAQGVKSTTGGIGYFENSFATQNSLPVAQLGDGKGNFVPLTADNTTKFLSFAKVTGTNGDLALTFNYANGDASAYPNVLVTYEIVCQKGTSSSKLPLLKNFLGYTVNSGQDLLTSNGYVKLPTEIQTQSASAVSGLS
jgi:phosphate transport system substrate-binding protein